MVFSTKNRMPLLNDEIRNRVFMHMKENAEKKHIWLDHVGGYEDHCHCLISLGREQTISKVAQLIKGESSFWINKNLSLDSKFMWQDDFWAVSVSEGHMRNVRKYIRNQEIHHRKSGFKVEIDEFMNKYGWSYIKE